VLYGLVIALLAVFLAGAGHGWGEGLYSSVAIVLAPFAGAGWVYRHQTAGLALAAFALVPAAYVDWLLCSRTSYVDRVWNHLTGLFLLWIVMWVAWQILALVVVLSHLSRRGAGIPSCSAAKFRCKKRILDMARCLPSNKAVIH
jgi:hypothetical protein